MTFAVQIRIVATVCASVAILTTSLRLAYRWSRRHLGLDDAWAAFSLVGVCFLLAGAWLRSDATATNEQRITGYFMLNVSFTCVLWSARMSILFSIMRIIPYLMSLRRYAYGSAVLFAAMWIVCLVQKIYICEHHSAWKSHRNVQCVLGKAVGAVELATDITADLILVILPIHLLWDIGISSSKRKLLIAIFSASLITTIVSIVHASFELGPNRNAEGIAAHVECDPLVGIYLLVICNLAVLVTWLVRAFRNGEDMESGSPSDGTSKRRDSNRNTRLTTLRFGTSQPPIVLTTIETIEDNESTVDGKDGELSTLKRTQFSVVTPTDTSSMSFGAEQMNVRMKLKEETRDSFSEPM